MVIKLKSFPQNFEETDDRSRLTEISMIHCKMEIEDCSGKKWVRRFPLPRKTFRALRVIKGFLGWIDGVEGGVKNGTIEFTNVPEEILKHIRKIRDMSDFALTKEFLFGKNQKLGICVIIKSLKKTYPQLTVKINGETICGGKTR